MGEREGTVGTHTQNRGRKTHESVIERQILRDKKKAGMYYLVLLFYSEIKDDTLKFISIMKCF